MRFLKLLLFFSFSVFCDVEISGKNFYYFVDEYITFKVESEEKEIPYKIRVITENGWGKEMKGIAGIKNREIRIKPVEEGINIIEFPSGQIRILVISKPEKLNYFSVKKTLPNTWEKLLNGKEYRILALGDSVTNTLSKIGGYEKILAMLLEKTTGNKNIKVINRSYPGRSIDATVRNFKEDILDTEPDLCLLMYGLNDEGGGSSLATYLKQYEYIGREVKNKLKKDIIFLQPTPHIDIKSNPPNFIFRTIVFGESLKEIGKKLNIPVAETFHYIWPENGSDLYEIAKNMWVFYPKHYSKYFSSLIESNGQGDTIHPNVLGHLKIAKSIYDAINGKKRKGLFKFYGENEWDGNCLKSIIKMKNISGKNLNSRLCFYPPYFKMKISPSKEIICNFKRKEEKKFVILWSEIKQLEELIKEPYIRFLETNNLYITFIDFGNKNNIGVIKIPFSKDFYIVKERFVSNGNVNIRVFDNGKIKTLNFTIPENKCVGRNPLILVEGKNKITVGEIVYARYGKVIEGNVKVDGNLSEWEGDDWIPVGEKFQVGWPTYNDFRENLNECYTFWAFKKGEKGFYVGVRAKGKVYNDWFTLFFDSRNKDEFGKVGKYYWLTGKIEKNGKIKLSKGETTKEDIKMEGEWKNGNGEVCIEMFIPYRIFEKDEWPESKELGVSIWWSHRGNEGKITNLYWSEVGHPWTPKWYGVLKLVKDKNEEVPYMVRIR